MQKVTKLLLGIGIVAGLFIGFMATMISIQESNYSEINYAKVDPIENIWSQLVDFFHNKVTIIVRS